MKRVLDAFETPLFAPFEPGIFSWLFEHVVENHDPYFHLADFDAYAAAQERVAGAVAGPGRLDAEGGPQRRPDGEVLLRPDDPRVRPRHLEPEARPAGRRTRRASAGFRPEGVRGTIGCPGGAPCRNRRPAAARRPLRPPRRPLPPPRSAPPANALPPPRSAPSPCGESRSPRRRHRRPPRRRPPRHTPGGRSSTGAPT